MVYCFQTSSLIIYDDGELVSLLSPNSNEQGLGYIWEQYPTADA